jgi:hypothetical protein
MSAKKDFKNDDNYDIGLAIRNISKHANNNNFKLEEDTVSRGFENSLEDIFNGNYGNNNIEEAIKNTLRMLKELESEIDLYYYKFKKQMPEKGDSTISIKALALILKVSEETIRNYAKSTYPKNLRYNTYLKSIYEKDIKEIVNGANNPDLEEIELRKKFDKAEVVAYFKRIDADKKIINTLMNAFGFRQ